MIPSSGIYGMQPQWFCLFLLGPKCIGRSVFYPSYLVLGQKYSIHSNDTTSVSFPDPCTVRGVGLDCGAVTIAPCGTRRARRLMVLGEVVSRVFEVEALSRPHGRAIVVTEPVMPSNEK